MKLDVLFGAMHSVHVTTEHSTRVPDFDVQVAFGVNVRLQLRTSLGYPLCDYLADFRLVAVWCRMTEVLLRAW